MSKKRFNALLLAICLLVIADATLTHALVAENLAIEINPIASWSGSLFAFFCIKLLLSFSGLLYIYLRAQKMKYIPKKHEALLVLFGSFYTLLVCYLISVGVTGVYYMEFVQ